MIATERFLAAVHMHSSELQHPRDQTSMLCVATQSFNLQFKQMCVLIVAMYASVVCDNVAKFC